MSRQKYIQGVKYVAVAALAATLTVALPAAPNAAIFNFALHDHPDGELVNPTYGLRLDGLFGDSSKDFTFTFDTSGASMFLDYDDTANTVRIHGTAFGGIDTGSDWDADNSGFVNLDFTYRANVAENGAGNWGTDTADLGIVVTEDAQTLGTGNSGELLLAAGNWDGQSIGDVFTLVDQDNGSFSFKLNNFDDHRLGGHAGYGGPETYVGWGWLNHAPGTALPSGHIYSSDWLFTAEILSSNEETPPVPEPGGLAAILGIGLAALSWHRRRTRTV